MLKPEPIFAHVENFTFAVVYACMVTYAYAILGE